MMYVHLSELTYGTFEIALCRGKSLNSQVGIWVIFGLCKLLKIAVQKYPAMKCVSQSLLVKLVNI